MGFIREGFIKESFFFRRGFLGRGFLGRGFLEEVFRLRSHEDSTGKNLDTNTLCMPLGLPMSKAS